VAGYSLGATDGELDGGAGLYTRRVPSSAVSWSLVGVVE
jgi:hypothetical protein